MAYTLNSIDLSTYGITPGHVPGSNIAMQGIFDLPKRIGQCFYEWAESNMEPWVTADEIFFGGRDIAFHGSIIGTNEEINDYLQALYDAVEAFTDLVVLSTPYGDFNVQVRTIVPEYFIGACRVIINFREPVVTITGGTLPITDEDNYTIDSIPFASFGLYYTKGSGVRSLSDLKEQLFTKYGSEGYQMSKRKSRTFDIKGFVMGTSLSDFQNKIKALYLAFSSEGMRAIIINGNIEITCFAVNGFTVENIILYSGGMIADFNINLISTFESLITVDSTVVPVDDTVVTVDE
jgi:hypothetical protein